jgi:group II intron reverse transcriptase/maturase
MKMTRLYSIKSKTPRLDCVHNQQDNIPKGLRILAAHWKICFNKPNKIFYDLNGLLKQESLWFAAYLRIKSNKGSKTPGPDLETIDALTKKRILELRLAVLNNNFNWKGVRQIHIAKPGKPGKTRPLGIPAINDRLVQEVLRSIIEPVFELQFKESSFGFRPNRSCHMALKKINTQMKDSIWFIEGDIQDYFPSINHKILIGLVQKRIQDPKIITLLKTGLKAKVFEKNKPPIPLQIGTPQGGILSPLLSNIFLHELDAYMETLEGFYLGPKKPKDLKKNPITHKLLRSGNKKTYYKLKIPSRVHDDPNYRNCKYLRYADDFVIGVLGPRSMAVEIRNKIQTFLKNELKIKLNLEKSKVTHITKGIRFLGYKFGRRFLFVQTKRGTKFYKRKMTIPTLDVDMKKVIANLARVNFCDGEGNPTPAFRFLRHPQGETNKKINTILRGLSNWWSIPGNRKPATARASYIIKYSIAKTYAAKFGLKTVAKVFKRGGNDLSKNLTRKSPKTLGSNAIFPLANDPYKVDGILFDRYWKIPKHKANKLAPNWKPDYIKMLEENPSTQEFIDKVWTSRKASATDPLALMGYRLEKALSSKGTPCVICGSFKNVEMHHKNPLKNIPKTVKAQKRHQMAIERKQIPLCKKHHLLIHRGKSTVKLN